MSDPPDQPLGDDRFLVSTLPPSRRQIRLATLVLLGLIAALVLTLPFANVRLTDTELFLPAYATAVLVNDLFTAALLFALFSIERSQAILVLSIGYLFAAMTVVPWALTFPGVFSPSGLLDAGLQSTAWIAAVRRIGFPAFVLAYALLKRTGTTTRIAPEAVPKIVTGSVAGVLLFTCGLTWLSVTDIDILPHFMLDATRVSGAWIYVPVGATLICVAGLAALWPLRRSVLDLWLTIVLCTLLIEILLLSFFSASRFSVGWWAGRAYGLVSTEIVLLVLLSQTTMLYAQLARSMAAERRTREARMATMQALSALIAHEVNQPLTSMVTNADAGLHWLNKGIPNVQEVRKVLERIVNDGHRAGLVVQSVRTMFKKGAQERVLVDMNGLILEVLQRARDEGQLGHIDVRTHLDDRLPQVTANPVQLQQVVSNLVANGIDAMSGVADETRALRLSSACAEDGNILITVKDSGMGIDPAYRDHIFEPFFTTKPDGMGMGLMICRSVIESHGGRLWMETNVPQGTIFRFTLPAADEAREG